MNKSVNNILEINLNKINIYKGNYAFYEKEKIVRFEQQKSAYKNQQKIIKQTERFIEKFRYKNTKATQVQSRIKMLKKLEFLQDPIEDSRSIKLIIPEPLRSPQKLISGKKIFKKA